LLLKGRDLADAHWNGIFRPEVDFAEAQFQFAEDGCVIFFATLKEVRTQRTAPARPGMQSAERGPVCNFFTIGATHKLPYWIELSALMQKL
jgi:hypothetical protein